MHHAMSESNVKRYIRLSYLIPELLELVDNDELQITAGVDLSYLSDVNQQAVYQLFYVHGLLKMDIVKSRRLKAAFLYKTATLEDIWVLFYRVPRKPSEPLFTITRKAIEKFLPKMPSNAELERLFIRFLVEKCHAKGRLTYKRVTVVKVY